jgi:hypothetical protein
MQSAECKMQNDGLRRLLGISEPTYVGGYEVGESAQADRADSRRLLRGGCGVGAASNH